MANMLDCLAHIARNAANIAMHGVGAAVGDAANTAGTAANIADEAAKIAGGVAGNIAGNVAGGAASIGREAAKIAQGSVGETAKIAVNITGLARNMVPEVGGGGTGAIAGGAAKIAGEAAKIAGGVAGGAVESAANIAGSAAHIAAEASTMAESAAEDAVKGASEGAARIAAEADKIAGAVAKGAIEGAAEGAARIAEEADEIAGAIARGIGGAAEGGATIMVEAAKIAGEAVKIAGEAAKIPGCAANVAKHLESITRHIAHIAGGAATEGITGGRALISQEVATVFERITDPDVALYAATDILRRAGEDAAGGLVKEAKSRALRLLEAEELLENVRDIFQGVDNKVIRNTVFAITRCIFSAMSPYLGRAPAIYEGVFSNTLNWETLQFILSNRSMLTEFLVDLVEPAKLYAMANSTDGNPSEDKMGRNKYNELNLNDPMNKHGAICQLQRLAKSIICVLKDEKDNGKPEKASLDGFTMDTRLETDNNGKAESKKQTDDFKGKETWLFVNGIAGEPYWLHLACNKLADKFNRKVQGIFNRSDGILWDLVECAGERRLDGEPSAGLIQRTRSSVEAQDNLKEVLERLLWPGNEEGSKVIIVAHSQGCLILRLVLEQFIAIKEEREWGNMKRLQVFTFGNPSVGWEVHKYCGCTEHFANEKDFVAKLGVLRNSSGYPEQSTFINKTWTGHLFGTQYSLAAADYGIEEGESKLLACTGGTPMLG